MSKIIRSCDYFGCKCFVHSLLSFKSSSVCFVFSGNYSILNWHMPNLSIRSCDYFGCKYFVHSLLSFKSSSVCFVFSGNYSILNWHMPNLSTYCFQGVMNGILRGCGLQVISVTVTLIAYYVFALPVGITLMFKTDLGLKGKMLSQTHTYIDTYIYTYYH